MTPSTSGMLPRATIVVPSRQRRPPSKKPMAILHFIVGLSYHHLRLLITGRTVSNANSADSSVIHLQTSVAVLAMSKSIMIVWATGHCSMSGNELADQHAKLSAAETQPDNTHEAATRRALIRRSSRHPSIHHLRLKVFTSLLDEQIVTFFSKTERFYASTMVITLLVDAGSILWESPWMPSADCAVRKSNMQNIYGYDVQRFWRNDAIATLAIR